MSEKNQIPEDDIEQILREYQKQRSERNDRREEVRDDFLPPPVRREDIIDFSKPEEKTQTEKEAAPKADRRKKKSEAQLAAEKEKRAKQLAAFKESSRRLALKIKTVLFNKITLSIILIAAVTVGGVFAARAIVSAQKTAYLKPYIEKYNVEFPEGILEKYCDLYGTDQNTAGYLEIDGTEIKTPVFKKSAKKYPACEDLAENAEQGNFVIYTDDRSLEKLYATAEGYNSSAGRLFYSDLFNEYSFRIVGAFYTNINPKDDGGYLFPYNTAEKMTAQSADALCDRVSTRLLYDVGLTITRQDRMIFISCPTDFRKNFRFVLVGVQRDDLSAEFSAKEKKQSVIHYPQSVLDEMKLENPYRFAKRWYPEYEITNSASEKTETVQTEIKDYESRYPAF